MILPELQDMVQKPSGKEKQIEEVVKQITLDSVRIVSTKARCKGDDMAVRVETTVDRKAPQMVREFAISECHNLH
jgi:hypothetical protein